MRKRYIQVDGELIEVDSGYQPEPRAEYHVMPDVEPFRANDGTVIKGRSHWREHLRQTGAVELGHSDISAAQARHAKAREQYQAKIAAAMRKVEMPDLPYRDEPARPRSRIAAEVLGRLHGREMPDRKTVIKMALEEAKRKR